MKILEGVWREECGRIKKYKLLEIAELSLSALTEINGPSAH